MKTTVLPLIPLFQLTAFLVAACPSGGCAAGFAFPNLSWLVAPLLVCWVAVGAHDVYRLVTVHLGPHERRLFEIATGLRLVAGLLVSIGVLVGLYTDAAPAMLVAAATLVAGSTWFDERARSADAARPEAG